MNQKDKSKTNKNNKKTLLILLVLIVILAVALGATYFLMKNKEKDEENTLSYTDLIKEISYGNVEKVELKTGSKTAKIKMKNIFTFWKFIINYSYFYGTRVFSKQRKSAKILSLIC